MSFDDNIIITLRRVFFLAFYPASSKQARLLLVICISNEKHRSLLESKLEPLWFSRFVRPIIVCMLSSSSFSLALSSFDWSAVKVLGVSFFLYLAKKIRQNSIITTNSQGWNLKSGFLAFTGPSGQGSNFKNPAILASQTLTYGPFSGPSLKGRRSTFGVEFLWFPSYDSHLDNFGIFKTTHREKDIS